METQCPSVGTCPVDHTSHGYHLNGSNKARKAESENPKLPLLFSDTEVLEIRLEFSGKVSRPNLTCKDTEIG